ncbi:hypothetical protein DL770_004021 [Monosporascus sp. CRB-9-2]|nr:hypothetical protein DL770_004021 [Monosporascus sp. CRB-9-2]
MSAKHENKHKVSAAFFCPQTKSADEGYLASLHAFLSQNQYGQILLGHIAALADDQLWELFAAARDDVRALTHGPECLATLRDWAANGISGPLAATRANITSLPLLAVLQIGQYLRYLEVHGISHQEFLADVQEGAGGIHGYCGGLPAAICIACAESEDEVVKHMATAMKILVGIGAYTEAADEDKGAENTLLAIRLKYEGQAEELTRQFPGTYISGITGPKSVSIGGPATTLREFFRYVTEHEGIRAQKIDLGGSAHNPQNSHLAAELCRLCSETPGLRLPEASQLLVPLRSNQTGHRLLQGSLTDDLVHTMLAARCEWLNLLKGVAQDLTQSHRAEHHFVIFGWDDCVTMFPFHQARLRITKIFAKKLIPEQSSWPNMAGQGHSASSLPYSFPENSIAIVGASCRLPGANNMDELWDLIAKGKDCVEELSTDRFNLHGSFRAAQSGSLTERRPFYGNFIHDVKRFDHAFFGISAREAANMDPQQRIMLELSFEALEDAGYLASHQRSIGDNVGCFIGLVLGEYADNTNGHPPTAYASTGTVPAFICGRLSHVYGWSGPAEMLNTACSSSLVAINRACKAIQAGECRMATAGGVNVITGVNTYLDLAKAGFLSPTGQCKSFDASADGYCRADGAGLVVLKKLKQAMVDGDAIWGVIPGVATNQGGLSASLISPDTNAQQALYRTVLKQAGLQGDQVTYVEAHGTGTQVGDPVEMDSIRSVVGSASRQHSVYVGSIKANIGHCEPAAGVAGLLKVLAMLRHGHIPPQANYRVLSPKIAPLDRDGMAISNSLRPWDAPFRVALVNSYGAAGSNAALLCCDIPRQQFRDGAVAVADAPKTEESSSLPLISFPLLLTAASEASLLETGRTLGVYLDRKATELNIRLADVAFTLNKRRQRQKYFTSVKADTIEEAVRLLLSFSRSNVSELPAASDPPRAVVFTFSGQTSRTIALPKSLYDSFPAFRSYLDACDAKFRILSNASLLQAIFQTGVVEDIAALQCGVFAVQYACAQCWIDAGARPRAVIGHSLGELTALAVSGVLSLEDTITLVATRARLIEKKWGPDKGSMLSVECTAGEFEEISSLVKRQNGTLWLEIACFNGPTSLVIAGPTTAIAAAENVLRTQPGFQRIRFQHLKTSHGFHSALTEPILADLAVVAQSLKWNEPTIPLYACTEKPEADGTDIHGQDPARHARQPVFFVNAVRRIEDALGPCLWLEAGVDTSIMSMTRKACRQPDVHMFQSVKTRGFPRPADVIADVVPSLWRTGTFLSHWSFVDGPDHSPAAPQPYRPVWLPPYQFAQTRHWVDNIDRVVEVQNMMQAQLDCMLAPAKQPGSPCSPPPLVIRRLIPNVRKGYAEFLVNTQNARFRSVVGGHVVCSRPLCPAPLHMECATAALMLLLGDDNAEGHQAMKNASLTFEELQVSSPLGVDPQGEVVLRLEGVPGARQAWRLTVISCSTSGAIKGGLISGETVHAEGVISLNTEPMLDNFKRIVSRQIRSLVNSHTSERLQCSRAYKLFERVVKYGDFFMGIETIQLNEHEAVATVKIPQKQPHRDKNRFWTVCDAVVLDMCIHVLGLLVNTSDWISREDVAVMVGLDRVVISPAFKMDLVTDWRVCANYDFASGQHQPIGDVFVCSPEGELVAMFIGCRMTRLPVVKLEKALDAAFSTSRGVRQETTPNPSRTAPTVASTNLGTRDTGAPSTQLQGSQGVAQQYENTKSALRELVAECTMVDKSSISESTALALVGLDSLGSAELSEELSSKFGLSISSNTLLESTLAELQQLLGAENRESTSSGPGLQNFQSDAPQVTVDDQEADSRGKKFFHILAEASGTLPEDIKPGAMLAELGIDSLSFIDLKQEFEDTFSVDFDLEMDTTVQQVMTRLGIVKTTHSDRRQTEVNNNSFLTEPETTVPSLIQSNPFDTLRELGARFDSAAITNGLAGYWSDVAPLQNYITLAYIVEGFSAVGVDLRKLTPGEQVPHVPHLSPKYDKLVQRCWEILQKRGIVSISHRGREVEDGEPQAITRGSCIIDGRPASQLLKEFGTRFPAYQHETDLIGLTGPRLADCLSGNVDSVSLMFGSPQALKTMENYYSSSPLTATLAEQLVVFVTTLLRSPRSLGAGRPVRILEVGGGTGGTTRWLAEALDTAGIAAQYTFTDISPSLVKKAKSKFQQQYPWITYAILNLEVEVRPEFLGQFDVVFATNTVHATSDRRASCRRMRETLTPAGGLLVLAETTSHIEWCDICFGLLDGWWLAEGPIAPLQTAQGWMRTLAEAGFVSMGYSNGSTADANIAQLLVGCNTTWDTTGGTTPMLDRARDGMNGVNVEESGYRLETMVYKEVDEVQIHADVYYPKVPSPSPMPIALMIHGGGYVTLSRRALRPAQTRYLISRGLLPVGIDYRLCPEINIIEGPITDVCDAYRWAREALPGIASRAGMRVDPERVVVIGWSTGGQLAMSLGWTAEAAGMPPPNAVLSFYGPVDFESGELDSAEFIASLPKPEMSLERIVKALPSKPVTNSNFTGEASDLGWVRPGDPRSELLITMSKQGIALPVLFNGLQSSSTAAPSSSSSSSASPRDNDRTLTLAPPSPERVASVSPLARLCAGQYAVPTFIIHGTEDEVAPFTAAERFVVEMRRRGVVQGFLPLRGVRHLFDLGLKEGSRTNDPLCLDIRTGEMEDSSVPPVPSGKQFYSPGSQIGSKDKSVGWYDKTFPGTPNDARALLESYARIPPDEVDPHVLAIPSYASMLDRLKQGAKYLEIGFCLGQDIRKLVADGAPSQNIYGVELEAPFIDLGYDLFRDKETLKAHFTQADALDLTNDSTLSKLAGTMDYVHFGMVIHVFDRNKQRLLLENCVQVLKPEAGSLILGESVGDVEGIQTPAGNFMHSDDTFREMWKEISERTGLEFDCRVTLDKGFEIPEAKQKWGYDRSRRLAFEVEMLGHHKSLSLRSISSVKGAMASPNLFRGVVWFVLSTASASAYQDMWRRLNQTVHGRLHTNEPLSRSCFSTYNGERADVDEAACAAVRDNYGTLAFRLEYPGAYITVQDEMCLSDPADQCLLDNTVVPAAMPLEGSSCNQGSVPDYYIEVEEASDVVAAFQFAKANKVPVVIKNSGHDYMSRNSQKGALSLWVHNLKGLTHHDEFTPEGCRDSVGRAITAGAGEITGDLYAFASAHNSTFVGGYSDTIAASGGWVQGGGHSVLSPVYGMGVDRVAEFKVVTPNGELRTANRCRNADLFRSLRGGGGGTFGVVLEATHRVEPAVPVVMASIRLPDNITSEIAMKWIELQVRESLRWGREGWGGHVAGTYLAHMNPLPAFANMSDGGAKAVESMRKASEFALALGGTSEIEVMPDWLALWNKYLNRTGGAGIARVLTSRLVPQSMFADDTGMGKIMGFIGSARDLGFDPKSFYTPAGLPFVADKTIGRNRYHSENHGTSVHPAWYSSLWSLSAGIAIPWNATLKERLESLARLTEVTRLSEALTGPEGGAYPNEANPFTDDWREAWWGPNYGALLETKKRYDPHGLLKCWKCVGFEDSDISSPRFRCQGKLQKLINDALS